MKNVSETIQGLLDDLRKNRDNEVSMLAEALPQYVTDHNDKEAYRQIDRQVNALAKAFDRMERLLERTLEQSEKIEASVENYYGN